MFTLNEEPAVRQVKAAEPVRDDEKLDYYSK
jgi:hypothetical protein